MPRPEYLITAVAVSAAVTWSLRALPFAAVAALRGSRTVQYLGTCMPAGVMVILLGYCLRNVSVDHAGGIAPLLALTVTVGLHLWRGNAVLSIAGGTLVEVALASTIVAH